MRAAHIRENLELLSLFDPEIAGQIRDELGAQTIETIEHARRVAWLPLQLDVDLSALVHLHTGRDGLRRWSQFALKNTLQTPLLNGFLAAGFRLLGSSPTTIIKLLPRGFSQIYRNCGKLVVADVRDSGCALRGEGLAGVMLADEPYMLGVGDAFLVPLELLGFSADFDVETSPKSFAWHIRWSRAAESPGRQRSTG